MSPALRVRDLPRRKPSKARELRDARLALGFTQSEMASRLGVSPGHLSRLELGKVRITPTLHRLARLVQE